MIVTTERIRYFVAVAELGSFSAAARQLGVSISAVNKTVTNLEDDLEVLLFERSSGKKPALTNEGKSFYFKSLDVLPRILGMEQYAEALKEGIESHISIAVHPYSSSFKYWDLIRKFTLRYPQVQVEIIDSESLTSLDEGYDILIAPSRIELVRGMNLLTIGQLDWLIVCAPNFPLAQIRGELEISDLEEHLQLMMPEGFITKPEYREALRFSSNTLNVSQFYQYQQLLLDGVGFAPFPADLARQFIEEGKLVELSVGALASSWPIDLVWSKSLGPAGHYLVDQLCSTITKAE